MPEVLRPAYLARDLRGQADKWPPSNTPLLYIAVVCRDPHAPFGIEVGDCL